MSNSEKLLARVAELEAENARLRDAVRGFLPNGPNAYAIWPRDFEVEIEDAQRALVPQGDAKGDHE